MTYQECINKFKNILYTEVGEYDKRKKTYQKLEGWKSIQQEIIDLLSNLEDIQNIEDNFLLLAIQFQTVYGEKEGNRYIQIIRDSVNSIKSTGRGRERINHLLEKLKKDYEKTNYRIELLKVNLYLHEKEKIEYRKILSNYKYQNLITPEQIDIIQKVMNKYNLNPKEQIMIFESIRIHNTKLKYEDAKISYTVVNMLSNDYKKIDISEIDELEYQERLSLPIESYYELLKQTDDIESIISTMPTLDAHGIYDEYEINYIYASLINLLVDDLNENINSISNPEIYHDIELRKVVIMEYGETRFKYNKLMNLYQQILAQIEAEEELEILDVDEEDQTVEKNILFYETRGTGETTYLENDLKSFPEEYLSRVRALLENKKTDIKRRDKQKPFRAVDKSLRGYDELRDDQVRIVYKHIKDNCYSIIGAFVKKGTNAQSRFVSIANRGCKIDISTKEAFQDAYEKNKIIESRIYKYLEEEARKGSR